MNTNNVKRFELVDEAIERGLTPFDYVRDLNFEPLIQSEINSIWNRGKNIDDILKHIYLPQVVIKPNAMVRSSIRYKKRRVSSRSIANLVQYEDKKINDALKSIRNIEKIEDVNGWAKSYIAEYEAKKEKKYRSVSSKQVSDKIYRIASVFVRSVLSGFVSPRGFRQRSISFCTFTITEKQKHSDTEIIKMFVDFLDHLKKVNNYIIDPITRKETKEKALILENYIWRAETQENGNIHFHLLADTFLNQHMLRRVWNNYLCKLGYKYGYGSANVNSLKRDKNSNKILNVERYLCKYLTKPPLRDKFKGMKLRDLEGISDVDKFRRPVLGKNWGCSRALTKLEYPKFYGEMQKVIVEKMRDKLKEVKMENVPDFISVYVGDTRKALRDNDILIQRAVKVHYEICHSWLYWDTEVMLN